MATVVKLPFRSPSENNKAALSGKPFHTRAFCMLLYALCIALLFALQAQPASAHIIGSDEQERYFEWVNEGKAALFDGLPLITANLVLILSSTTGAALALLALIVILRILWKNRTDIVMWRSMTVAALTASIALMVLVPHILAYNPLDPYVPGLSMQAARHEIQDYQMQFVFLMGFWSVLLFSLATGLLLLLTYLIYPAANARRAAISMMLVFFIFRWADGYWNISWGMTNGVFWM